MPSRLSLQVAISAFSSGRVMAVFLRDRSPRLTAARAARLSTVRIAGCSQGLAACLSRCAVDSTATRCRTVASVQGPSLAFRPPSAKAWSTAGGTSPTNPRGKSPVKPDLRYPCSAGTGCTPESALQFGGLCAVLACCHIWGTP